MTRFLVVPQWQGSSSARAMQLVDGAEAIAGDLPRSSTARIEVPLEAGESLGTGVRRYASLQQIAQRQREAAIDAPGDEYLLTVGGDAGVAVTAALQALGAGAGSVDPDAVVVWFSAHADLHDPETSPTGAFDTMAARALVDAAIPAATDARLDPSRLVLAGLRDLDPGEEEQLARLGATVVPADELSRVADAVAALAPSRVFVHVDLDVLDPAELAGVADAVPFGPDAAALVAAIRAVRTVAPLAGAALTEFSPASLDAAAWDLGTILRVIAALA
ncbi:arginase family protein [Microbacterium sp. X-17]|uniref:arginase family protein n=1 Tax=Microbacterium sp. X-17 TaxID=3144404 RepID=UPI0031F59909